MKHAGPQRPSAANHIYGARNMELVRSFLRVLLATLREIFDENAYQRFLVRSGNVACVQSYREFQREREAGMTNRPKCC